MSVAAAAGLCASALGQTATPFATRVVQYRPAPGQSVNSAGLNDPQAALGAPVGGTVTIPNNTKVVTLGGFGGSITLGFAGTVRPAGVSAANPQGIDFIVYGNAFCVAGDCNRRWAEGGVIEISRDVNGNGLADDPWFVIRGSHLPSVPASVRRTVTYDAVNPALPPVAKDTFPQGLVALGVTSYSVSAFELPRAVFGGPVVANPLGAGSSQMGIFGYADFSPTVSAGAAGMGQMTPEAFFVRAGNPMMSQVASGLPGGDGIAMRWAVNPATGAAANLDGFDFVRITTAMEATNGVFGEVSTEIGGVAALVVEIRDPADFNGDGVVNVDDLSDYITGFFATPPDPRCDFNRDAVINVDDLSDFITAYFSR